MNDCKDCYRQLVDRANKAIKAYYIDDNPILTDEEYDKLIIRIANIESEHPDWLRVDSPTRRVGGAATSSFEKVTHPRPMLSLKNGFTAEDIRAFGKAASAMADDKILYIIEPKLDGLTMVCSYENGSLVRAVTRGDGLVGEDVTLNAMCVQQVPVVVPYKGRFQVRGEVIMLKKDFIELNEEQAKKGNHVFANARNAAAGSLRQKDPSVTRDRKLTFIVYDAFGLVDEYYDEIGKLKWLRKQGFSTVVAASEAFDDIEDAVRYCDNAIAWRGKLPMDIDGLVLKVDKLHVQERLGETDVFPRWALAYKFPAQHKAATLEAVVWQIGRTGRVTPVAVFSPIELGGATVDHASLHNLQYVKVLELRIGDVISVYKAAEIIPQVASVVRHSEGCPVEIPTKCPECGTQLIEETMVEGTTLVCPNENCNARRIAWLSMFASRERMDIQGLGDSLIKFLVYEGLCKTPADLYTLTEDDLIKLPLVGERKAQLIIAAIERSKKQDAVRVLASIGVPGLGRRAADALLTQYKNIPALLEADASAIAKLPGFGETTAQAYVSGLHAPATLELIERLKEHGLQMALSSAIELGGLTGQVFCITGQLSQPREVFAQRIRDLGGRVESSVTKRTNYLLAGADGGRLSSKRKKANDLGISILSEEDFEELIK